MDTNELMNTETIETATDAINTVGTAIANTATTIAQNVEPEIRYVEVPVEGSANLGAFVIGAVASALITIGGYAGVKLWKGRKAKKAAAANAQNTNSENLTGYERNPEPQQNAEPNAEENPAENVETVTGTVEENPAEKK